MPEELRKAGKYERIYKSEHDFTDKDGVLNKFYEDHFVLSSGETVDVSGFEKVEQNGE